VSTGLPQERIASGAPVVVVLLSETDLGVALVRRLRERDPSQRIVVARIPETERDASVWMRIRPEGWVGESSEIGELVSVIQSVAAGGRSCSAALGSLLLKLAMPPPLIVEPEENLLTIREVDVLRLLASEMSNKQIAAVLGVRPTTVKNHAQRIFTKLGVHNRRDAVAVARATGLASPTAG
jgi:DNA-binding NarL/FixJ family response regulator